MIRRSVIAIFTLWAMACPLTAQAVTPGNRVLIIDAGTSASFRVRDTDGCAPAWSATSSDPDLATVSPGVASAGVARTFVVKAAPDAAGSTVTVTVGMTGSGVGCAEDTSVGLTVVVVGDHRRILKVTRHSVAKNLKQLRKGRKFGLLALRLEFADLLVSTQQKLSQVVVDEVEGASVEDIVRGALWDGFREQAGTLSGIMYGVFVVSSLVAVDAHFAVRNHGSLAYMPPALLVGGGGIWDAFHGKVYDSIGRSVGGAFALYERHLAKLASLAADHGVHLNVALRPRVESVSFPPLTGPSGVELDTGRGGWFPELFSLQVFMVVNWTEFDGPPAGSVLVAGLADATQGDVEVSLQSIDGGDPITGTAVVARASGSWRLRFGPDGAGGAIPPGIYTLSTSQGDTTLQMPVDITAR